MRKIIIILSVMFCVLSLTSVIWAKEKRKCFGECCLLVKEKKTGADFFVDNQNDFPVSLVFTFSGNNINYDVNSPYEIVVPPQTHNKVFQGHRGNRNQKWNYKYNYKWRVGDFQAQHDDSYRYRVPFKKGDMYEVGQSCHGSWSHNGSSKYAVDLIVPVGTPIYAARAGVVANTKEDSNKGGKTRDFRIFANFVKVVHSDGTVATYTHLKQNGVAVQVGKRVKSGDLLGYSGNTGFSTRPHLHFSVYYPVGGTTSETVPFVFETKDGDVSCPRRGDYLNI